MSIIPPPPPMPSPFAGVRKKLQQRRITHEDHPAVDHFLEYLKGHGIPAKKVNVWIEDGYLRFSIGRFLNIREFDAYNHYPTYHSEAVKDHGGDVTCRQMPIRKARQLDPDERRTCVWYNLGFGCDYCEEGVS